MSQYSLRFTMCVCTIGFGCNYQIEVASLWFVCLPWQHLWVPLCLFICSVSTIGCKFDLTSRKRGVWSFNRSQTWGCFWRTHFFRFSSTHSHLVLSLPPLPLLMPTHWLLTDSHSTLLHQDIALRRLPAHDLNAIRKQIQISSRGSPRIYRLGAWVLCAPKGLRTDGGG